MCSCGCELVVVMAEKRRDAPREISASPGLGLAVRPQGRSVLAMLAGWLAGCLAGGDPALRGSR